MAGDKDNRDLALIDHFQLHFIELNRAIELHDNLDTNVNTTLKEWIDYFIYEGTEVEKMQYAIESNNIIEKAHETYKKFTASDELRWAYEAKEKYKKDTATIFAGKVKEGEARGEARGKANAIHNVVINLKEVNTPIEQIMQATGLSKEEIENIK